MQQTGCQPEGAKTSQARVPLILVRMEFLKQRDKYLLELESQTC